MKCRYNNGNNGNNDNNDNNDKYCTVLSQDIFSAVHELRTNEYSTNCASSKLLHSAKALNYSHTLQKLFNKFIFIK